MEPPARGGRDGGDGGGGGGVGDVTAIECDDAVNLAANPTALLQLRLVASNALAALAGMGVAEA